MREEEIRIGNWVKGIEVGTPYQITQWHFFDAQQHDNAGDGSYWDYVRPIKLTEEWLLKFGFKVTSDNPKSKSQYKGDILFYILDFEFSNSEKGQDGGFYSYQLNSGNTIVRFVHQLQNLYYALTGQELTINQSQSQPS